MINQPKEIMGIYDNGGHTMDRYSIWILFEDGRSYLITTNAVASVWDIGENYAVDIDALSEDVEYRKNIGEEIEWSDLPEELRETIISYFNDEFTYDK